MHVILLHLHVSRLVERTNLVSSVLGIKAIQPGLDGEMKVVFDLGNGKSAILSIQSDVRQRRIIGASVSNVCSVQS